MNDQNQNGAYTQPQDSVSGLQSQSSSAPISSQSSGLQGQGAGGVLFSSPGNTGLLLNQTQVLNSSSTSPAPQPTATSQDQNNGGVPVHLLLFGLVALVVLTWFFRRKGPEGLPDLED